MMSMSERPPSNAQCAAMTAHNRRCRNPAAVQVNGVWYCRMHARFPPKKNKST